MTRGEANWVEQVDEATGRKFWLNADTGFTSWDDPNAELSSGAGGEQEEEDEEGADEAGEWEEAQDDSGNTYYYNTATGETSWENPAEKFSLDL